MTTLCYPRAMLKNDLNRMRLVRAVPDVLIFCAFDNVVISMASRDSGEEKIMRCEM